MGLSRMMAEVQTLHDIEKIEQAMLDMPQVECPVVHHFGPNIYMREVTLKAGTFAIGHAQKFEHLNIVLTGSVAIIDNGQVKTIKAPTIFVGKPGRKMGYVLEDTVWLNVYSTNETDIDKLEETYLDKSTAWQDAQTALLDVERKARELDRQDFRELIQKAGFTEELVRQQSENEDDQIAMPEGFPNVTVRASSIEGKGVFLTYPVKAGEIIGPGRLQGKRTPIGRYTNHSMMPNAKFVKNGDDIWLVALQDIHGCMGGNQGDEVTVNYRQALALSGIGEAVCQE
jgi:hypothetical protein